MITFANPITIQLPPITNPDGTQTPFDPIVLTGLDYKVVYDNTARVCRANFKGLNVGVVLWKGDDYTKAGNWTDADTDARLTALLGSDPQKFIQNLLPKPFVPPAPAS